MVFSVGRTSAVKPFLTWMNTWRRRSYSCARIDARPKPMPGNDRRGMVTRWRSARCSCRLTTVKVADNRSCLHHRQGPNQFSAGRGATPFSSEKHTNWAWVFRHAGDGGRPGHIRPGEGSTVTSFRMTSSDFLVTADDPPAEFAAEREDRGKIPYMGYDQLDYSPCRDSIRRIDLPILTASRDLSPLPRAMESGVRGQKRRGDLRLKRSSIGDVPEVFQSFAPIRPVRRATVCRHNLRRLRVKNAI